MTDQSPAWHALLAPLPADATPRRTPVASAEAAAHPEAHAIAGWHQLVVELSEPGRGMRHVLVVLDAREGILSASDGVLITTPRDGGRIEYVHESLGGRFADDGEFFGTHWHIVNEGSEGAEEVEQLSSKSRRPTSEEVDALKRLVAEVVRRAPSRGG